MALLRFPFLTVLALTLAGCVCVQHPSRSHVLEGAWQAKDRTIFIFRHDGTFHGMDYRKREIWGNWVALSDSRIGFQSLLHDSYYNPQYAIIDESDSAQMDYIVTGGTHFIHAMRIDPVEAERTVDAAIADMIHHP